MKAGRQAEQFGQFVISKLRDGPLDRIDAVLSGTTKFPRLRPLSEAVATMTQDQREVVRRCVRMALDQGLHDFLFALGESHDMEKGIEVLIDGENIAEQSDGLAGELFGENGWFARYSKHGPEVDPA